MPERQNEQVTEPLAPELAPLLCIDALEVSEPRLEKRKLAAVYRVHRGGAVEETELAYRFDEDVFDPADAAHRNLAAVAAAQVALNYGLFCRRIVLHGLLDAQDRRFLNNALHNTAREIYVNKLLRPNPFILPPLAELPVVKRRNYAQAELAFDEPPGKIALPWRVERDRHAVLSSGGKDSLLSYGLLDELGRETHPIFVNESGRHWFTALNAFRHFSGQVPRTARVWTNADRVFSFMLRHLSFVRQDFANVRADIYPVRLWTVAVFIFGALPLLLKRGVGRLVIGDEYDTSLRLNHRGIPHYGGLYDQSRFFDEMMSRYFSAKRWSIAQFSLLRPLSELLIEKTLAERYPALLRHQVSCHATHTAGERVLPCGKCEKCRRIIGMLSAIGVSPSACGYTAEQIDKGLADLATQELHQEKAGAEHLAWMLSERGLVTTPTYAGVRPHRRPEVMQLRFDAERSPPDAIPNDLRQPLYRLLLEHAEGTSLRSGRLWATVDPFTDAQFVAPYDLEAPRQGRAPGATREGRDLGELYLLGELTWPKAKKRLAQVDIALLPVGSIEQHGPHLPLDTDAYDADYLARAVAAACSIPRPLVLPLVPYGVAYHHQDFSGTISVAPDTLARLVYEIGVAVARQGVTKLLIINGHGGNVPALKFAAQLINRDARIFTAVDTGESSDAEIAHLTETRNDVHAGEVETSTSLATRPHLVEMNRAVSFEPQFSSRYLDFSSKVSVEWFAHTSKISQSGILGDPTKASAEKGEKILEVAIRNLVEMVEELKLLSLDEIFQRRY